MNLVRRVIGMGRARGTNEGVVSQTNQDDALCLMHLRKLFMELLHSPEPLTIREQEMKLYQMLPLFCKVFSQARPSTITERFGDACQFAAHVSRLMANEIKRRAANKSKEAASKKMMEFLQAESVEEAISGWNLLNALNILAAGETPVVECMVAASLPSNMVKCLYLFYELPREQGRRGKTLEEIKEERSIVQKLYCQVLVKLCNHAATARELVHTDELSVLFAAISCACPVWNIEWRSCVSEILMTLTRHGLEKEVVEYIHGKSCIAQCIMSMRRIQSVNPLELVEMIVALVCCLKDSADISHLLLADFRSCHGYLFLTDLLLMLGEKAGEEAREACRNVIHLVASLVMIGHVPLRPLISIGTPFQDPKFEVPQPLGKGFTIQNIEAFQVLQTVFLKSTDTLVCKIILECIHNIYSHDNANFFILEPQHTLSLFIEKAPEKAPEVQEKLFELLELVIRHLNWVPCQELMSVSIMFKNKKVADCHLVALSFMFRVLTCEPKYKDIFREVGILEVLTHCLKHYANALKEKQNSIDQVESPVIDKTDYSHRNSLVPDLESAQLKDYPLLLMGCLRLLLEGNAKNATVFRECGGARCVHNMVPHPSSRADALRIIHELILSGGNDDLGTLLGLMHTAPQSEVRLKIDVLHALLKVFDLDPKTRAVFREVGGFVYVMSLLIGMEGCLAVPCSPTWQNISREDILALLRRAFHVLTAAMQDEPSNKSFFMDEVRFRGLSDTIRLLGCFNLTAAEIQPCNASEDLVQRLRCKRQASVASQHTPLTPQRSDTSVRSSSTMFEMISETLELDPSSSLFAASEMFKNLFDMSTDSFSARSGTYNPPDLIGSGVFPHSNFPVPHIYHSGAMTAMVDLFPAVCDTKTCNGATEETTVSEDCLELQLHWISKLQQLLKSEHNQQVMCEAGLPLQLLQKCEAAFVSEDHPLHSRLQRMFERLASQALSPTVLRDFLRLGSPLFSKALDTMEEKSDIGEKDEAETENELQHVDVTDDDNPRVRKISQENSKRLSDATGRVPVLQRPRKQSILSYQDISSALSKVQEDLDMSSCEESDSDGETGFEIVGSDSKTNPRGAVASSDTTNSTEEIAAVAENASDENDLQDMTPVRPVRRRDKKRLGGVESSPELGFCGPSKALFCTVDNSPSSSSIPGTVVDGVDIEQGVASIDQGDDMVILDMHGETSPASNLDKSSGDDSGESPSQSDDSTLETVASCTPLKHFENDSLANDECCLSSLDEETGSNPNFLANDKSKQVALEKVTSSENNVDLSEIPPEHVTSTPVKRLTSVSELNISKCMELMDGSLHGIERERSGSQTSNEIMESLEVEEVPKGHGGGPVPLTRVKCLVSMTTPRDARAQGSTDTPSFVEFDMSIDGFGCLFLPAIAPQAAPGIASVGAVVAAPTVMGAVPGIGSGERMFPPQAGLTFAAWVCIDRYSSPNDDPHPVRLLTIARQFRSMDSTVHNVPCLTISISARDKMLVVSTEEGRGEDDKGGPEVQLRREKDHTEARFLSDQLLEEGRWHHVVVVLNRAMIRNSTATLFVDGSYVASSKGVRLKHPLIRPSLLSQMLVFKHLTIKAITAQQTYKLRYIQANVAIPNAATVIVAPYIVAYIGTAPINRRCSRLLWKLGPTHLMEEPLAAHSANTMFMLGPNYVGSFQAPYCEDELVTSKDREALDPLVAEDKLMFGIYAHAQSVVTIAKIKKHYMKSDTKAIAKELGLPVRDNSTPVHIIHNTAAHLLGPSRTIGAVVIGCSGVRTFCPSPVSKLIECIGGVSALLGMVAMATDVEGLYASVKALSCVLRSNLSARRDMVRVRGYQILALLLKRKKHLLNTHILHLTFALVGTEDSNRESSVIPNKIAFRDLLCDLEVWREAPADLQKSLYFHFLELLGPGSEMHKNAELMQRLGLVPKLLFVLHDDMVSEATAQKIASVLSALLSNPDETGNMLRFGQFVASTLPAHPINENEVKLEQAAPVSTGTEDVDPECVSDDAVSRKRINLRNTLLYVIQCLLYSDDGQVDQSFADALQETLGFDWLLLFIQAHLHKSTVVRATRILVTMLSSPPALARFKEGVGNGGWLCGVEMILDKPTFKAAGFKVSTMSEGQTNHHEVNKEICNIPGFLLLNSLIPKHIEVAEIYHLVIALLLGHPVSDVYDGAQFDWDNLFSVFWASKPGGARLTPPSLQDPGCYSIYCTDAAQVLLKMTQVMVNEPLEGVEEGSWLNRYPETVIEFLTYLYRNVGEFGAVCTSQDFLENLVGILFPKRRGCSVPPQDLPRENEADMSETKSDKSMFITERTYLITHQAKKNILEFLRVIMTDCLTCTSSSRGLQVIDYILESYPSRCCQAAQAEYQTEVLCSQMEFFLGGNLLTNPSAGTGDHAKIVANAFFFASKMVDKLWTGNFSHGYKVVFEFIMNMIKAVKGQKLPMDKIYHSLNRTILYQLSRPLASLTDQTRLLEFLHTLAVKHDIIFVPNNNSQEFIAGVCHWLLVMGTLADRVEQASLEVDRVDAAAEASPNTDKDVADFFESSSEEDTGTSEMLRLLASSAERVWRVLIEEKRELIDDAFKPIDLPRPTFTSFTSSKEVMIDYMSSSVAGASLNLDLKAVRPLIGDKATRVWMDYISAEQRRRDEALSQQKPVTSKRLTVRSLAGSTRKTKKEKQDYKVLVRDSYRWTLNHVTVVRDLVKLHYKNHIQNYNLISKSVAEDWALMEADLTRERGLWGPPHGSRLDKWALDVVEGPHRMRKKMCRNDMFYVHYPFDLQLLRHRTKPNKYKIPVSLDSKHFYMLRGRISPSVGPIESLSQQQVSAEVGKKPVNNWSVSTDPSFVKEANEGSGADNQTIVKLLEAGEEITSMYRCARIQGLDTAEGLFLFGQEHFYVVDGVTMLSTKEIKDIDSLPPGTHEPIIPRSSHDKARSGTMERMCSRWAKEDIREVHKRRYLLQETALEVFLSDGHNHFLVFPKSVRNKVYDKLTPLLLMSPEESVSGMKRDADVEAAVGLINTLMGERNVTQRWERGEITNFQYLMHLNTLACRSYNDLMQYPVFPWVLADYDSEELDLQNPSTFRDLSKPMGAQTEARLKQFQKRFAEWEDPTGETPPYHYGTHYSSQMTVASYLIRMEPFSQHFIKLQGGHFDLADRLFHSVKDAWLSAAKTNMADVKELIPEFFYLPEFLTNDNNFDFGAKQNGDVLGDVVLPTWAKGDPREFIRLHRKVLECDYVSSHLHEWIDLIFGYKQQGQAAEEANNVFLYLFYEGKVDVHDIEDDVKRNAAIGVINNFGQTPKQLFRRPHPQKKVFRAQDTDSLVDRLFFHNLANLVPSAQPVKVLKSPVQEIIQCDRGMLAVENNKVLVPPHFTRYIAWGFGDLSMRTGHYETDKIIAVYENFHIGQVLCAACPDFRTLITGGTSTLVCVWDMVKGGAKDRKPQLVLHEVLYGHHAPVTCLTVSTAYNLIVSGSEDQTCIIWNLSKLSYVRQLPGHAAPITAVAINDLTGDICTCAGTYLYVWSVNGKLIAKENTSLQTNNHIQCCAMSELSEWDEQNVILTGSLDGVVRFWGIEFYDEAKTRRSLRPQKSSSEKNDTVTTSSAAGGDKSTTPTSGGTSTREGQETTPPSSTTLDDESRDQSSDKQESLTSVAVAESSEETGEESNLDVASGTLEAMSVAVEEKEPEEKKPEDAQMPGTTSPRVPRSNTLDDEYVIIENKSAAKTEGSTYEPVWRRRLVLRNRLTMHTAFDRPDNKAPASITALKISKDHKKLFVGDGRGRIYSWSVTDAAGADNIERDKMGRMANHWIKDESAESCSACNVRFATFERRHHCRDCGKVFCAKCSRFEAPINRLQIYRPVRVCQECFRQLTQNRGSSTRKSI